MTRGHLAGHVDRPLARTGRRPAGILAVADIAGMQCMPVAIALANKKARTVWAMLVRNEEYRDPTGAVC